MVRVTLKGIKRTLPVSSTMGNTKMRASVTGFDRVVVVVTVVRVIGVAGLTGQCE